MANANNTEEAQIKVEVKEEPSEERMETMCKIYVKPPHEIMNPSSLANTNDDVQRAIRGIQEMPDEELQGLFLDDEEFMEGLDVVDAWEGDEDKKAEHSANSREKREKPLSR